MRNAIKRPRIIEGLGRIPILGRSVLATHNAWVRHKYRRSVKPENVEAARLFREHPPVLNAVQRRVLADLERCGVAAVHFDELIGDAGAWEQLRRKMQEWLAQPDVRAQEERYRQMGHVEGHGKDYLIVHNGNSAQVPWDSPWLRLGLDSRILDIANSYLGLLSRMYNVDLWHTIARKHEGPVVGSQNWHRDGQCDRLVKLFLYFSDVGQDSGALEYVPHSRPGEKYGDLWPQELPHGSYPPPGELERRIPRSDWVACAHRTGTFVFVDTVGFHRGGRATKRNRLFATWAYCGHESAWLRNFSLNSNETPQNLNPALRYALLAA